MDNCTLDCIYTHGNNSYAQMCAYTQDQCQQDVIQFIQGYYCLFNESFMILIFLGIPILLLLFKLLNVIASEYLSPCIEEFIHQFKISPTLAGVTFLAFANGSPDVMTAIVAGSSDSSSTALIPFGSIFGACLFSTAFILSIVIMSQKNQSITLLLRQCALPLGFYITGILFIIGVTLVYGQMNIYLSSFLLLIYLIYIVIVLRNQRKSKKKQSLIDQQDGDHEIQLSQSDNQSKMENNAVDSQKEGFVSKLNKNIQNILNVILIRIVPFYNLEGWNPINSVISIILSPLFISLTQSFPDILTQFIGPIPIFLILSVPAILLATYLIYCIIRNQKPYYIKPFTLYSFIVCIALLAVVCSILINFIQLVQILTGINPVLLGLTVFAWANCIGDYLTITTFAKKGNYKTAVAGIFSGQLFNFLLGFSISLMIQSFNGPFDYKIFDFQGSSYEIISDVIVVTVIFGGLIYLILVFITAIRSRGVFMRKQALFSKWYYITFLVISCLLGIITDFFKDIDCPEDELSL